MTGIFDDPARAAAVAVARTRVKPGMTIGLGSGRAVFALVDALASTRRGPSGLRAVAASTATEARARAAGIELLGMLAALLVAMVLTAPLPPSWWGPAALLLAALPGTILMNRVRRRAERRARPRRPGGR